MFDTVRMRTTGFMLNRIIISQYKHHETTYFDSQTGTPCSKYVILDIPHLPCMKYYDKYCSLEIELSIPKYLYGDNVQMVDEADIDCFFTQLHQQLYDLFGIQLQSKKEWKCLRIDVSWNFQVGKKIHDYMRQLSMMRLPRKSTVAYNQVETVIFSNKSNRIMFYDKECECRKRKCSEDIIMRAAGILRLEISTPDYKMKDYANGRTAEELLTKDYFSYVTDGVLSLLHFSIPEEFPSEWIQSHPITQIETAMGFIQLYKRFGEGGLKQLFTPSTLRNRMALVNSFMDSQALPPLLIEKNVM